MRLTRLEWILVGLVLICGGVFLFGIAAVVFIKTPASTNPVEAVSIFPTHESTSLPAIESTSTEVAIPTATPVPFDAFNPDRPLKFGEIDLSQRQNVRLFFSVLDRDYKKDVVRVTWEMNLLSWVYNKDLGLDKALGDECGEPGNLVVFDTQIGDDLNYSKSKSVIFAHSGTCAYPAPFEKLREVLEGPWGIPNEEQRTDRIALNTTGQSYMCINDQCFVLGDIEFESKEDLVAAYEYDVASLGAKEPRYGAIDRFFTVSGTLREKHELFTGFCGSGGLSPADWFAARYYGRWWMISDNSIVPGFVPQS